LKDQHPPDKTAARRRYVSTIRPHPLFTVKYRAPLACLLLALPCCGPLPSSTKAEQVTVIDDDSLRTDFEKKMAGLVKSGKPTPHATLRKQLERKSCQLELPRTGHRRLSPSEVYQKRLGSTLMVGKLHHCSSSKCNKTHANIASGVVIREDGIVLTNYHVVNGGDSRTISMGAMTHDGRAFLVDEVLAADEKADVAILRLRDAKDLTAAPIFRDEPVGNPCTIISNPVGDFFTLSQGYVARYYLSDGRCVMNVTADYAKGSSGGPIFNDRGDVIGLVSNTLSIPYQHVPLAVDKDSKALEIAGRGTKPAMIGGKPLTIGTNHQMTIKNTVPSRSILDLIGE